ncbi:EAL domain-containing protein [Shewanella loihica]|uniref:Diguanylate cyclase/phosphodiesterase n=1 Tax=Shewanella loihica (strain ATCC BAA-1088 / PV-4) TaxID=323850 RepID=A3QEN3_SHELP|nr:diguanylate cyclase/phosphodiesterase [Shewanella loihica PV-4]
MGVGKSIHLLLITACLALTALAYLNQRQEIAAIADFQLKEYQADPIWQQPLPEQGQALFTLLTKQYEFQFFQYVHQLDGNLNYTQGELIASGTDLATVLFNQPRENTQALPQGRLQVKLSSRTIAKDALTHFTQTLIWIVGGYLALAVLFTLLMARQKRTIGYAVNALDGFAELKFDAIAHSRFHGELKPLGKALEHCRVALHDKFDQLQQQTEQLNREAYQDPVTLFGTRPKFTEKLDALAKPGKSRIGLMAMIKATELGHVNQSQGRAAGDDYLAGVATCIRKALQGMPNIEAFRISSADFAVFIPDLVLKDAQQPLEKLKAQFDEYQQGSDLESVAYIGMVPYEQGGDALSLVYIADAAVSIAQTLGPNSYHVQEKLSDEELVGDSHWKLAIEDIIKRRAIKFHAQDIQPCRGADNVYRELLSRFYSSEGKFLPTGTVIAMAERHGLSVELDKIIILSTLRLLLDTPTFTGALGINISTASVNQPAFTAWLKDIFVRQRQIASRLVLEVNEAGMQANIRQAHKFVRDMHSVGARVAVEHFGMGFTSFKFFKEVRPDFIKLDGSYSQGIDTDSNNRFFVKMIVDVARKQSVKVIASSIERQEEKFALEQLLVDGLQGFYIAKPKPFTVKDEQSARSQTAG